MLASFFGCFQFKQWRWFVLLPIKCSKLLFLKSTCYYIKIRARGEGIFCFTKGTNCSVKILLRILKVKVCIAQKKSPVTVICVIRLYLLMHEIKNRNFTVLVCLSGASV